jgi:hypothetical protein
MVSAVTFLKKRFTLHPPTNGEKRDAARRRKRKPMWTDIMIAFATLAAAFAGAVVAGLALWAAYSPADEQAAPIVINVPPNAPNPIQVHVHENKSPKPFNFFKHQRD